MAVKALKLLGVSENVRDDHQREVAELNGRQGIETPRHRGVARQQRVQVAELNGRQGIETRSSRQLPGCSISLPPTIQAYMHPRGVAGI